MNNENGFTSIDFFTGFESSLYVGKAVELEADIEEGEKGERGAILHRAHIGGGAYEVGVIWDTRPQMVRLNRTRFLKFFRLLTEAEINAQGRA